MSSRLLCGFLALMLLPLAAGATTTLTWPGVSCSGVTLQNCIDGAGAGARIEIATDNAINEDINLGVHSLTLTAADGYRPTFASGRNLTSIANSGASNVSVTLSHFTLIDGGVSLSYRGTGTGTYELSDLVVTLQSAPGTYLSASISLNAQSGTLEASVHDNRVTAQPPPDGGLIEIESFGATLHADIYSNQVTSVPLPLGAVRSGAGILVNSSNNGAVTGHGYANVHGNQVRGGFSLGAMFIAEGFFGALANSLNARIYNNVIVNTDGGHGLFLFVDSGSIDARAINNTVMVVGGTGITAGKYSNGDPGANIAGDLRNNVIVAHEGLSLDPGVTGALGNDYNLINADTNTVVALGAHTLTTPALLQLDSEPRLRAGSPAIDAADLGALLGLMSMAAPRVDLDADGLRRFKGASGAPDIGAYEFGDVNFTHVAASNTISLNTTRMNDSALDGQPGASAIVTPNYNAGEGSGIDYDQPFGEYYSGGFWSLFNENSAIAMTLGERFDVLVPAPGAGSFLHLSSAANIGGSVTTLDDASTNNQPGQIVLATQNWTAGGASIYNQHPIGVFYDASDLRWHIANLDGATMPQPVGFNVYAQVASANAWRVMVTPGNLAGGAVRLDHPLLDATPCARPQVTRLLGANFITGNFDVEYFSAKWYIFGYGGIALGEQFHVLVDAGQVFACTDRIFADGLE